MERGHPDMRESLHLAHELRAESVRRFVNYRVERRKMCDREGEAEKSANEIEDAISVAVKHGCPVDHPKIEKARKVAVEERAEEGLRKRARAAEERRLKAAAKGELNFPVVAASLPNEPLLDRAGACGSGE